MPMQLVVDNCARHSYLTNLLRIVHHDTINEPIPDDLKALLEQLDEAAIEDDLRQAISLMPCKGSTKPKTELRVVG